MVAELTKDETLSGLAKLSKDDLQEVALRVGLLLGNSQNATATDATPIKARDKGEADALQTAYDAITEPLRAAEGSNPIPLPMLLRSGYGAGFRKAAKSMDRLIREDFKTAVPVEKLKVAKLLVGLAAGEIEAKGGTVSLKRLCCTLQNAAGLCDRAFPFYRASGLLPMLIRRVKVK